MAAYASPNRIASALAPGQNGPEVSSGTIMSPTVTDAEAEQYRKKFAGAWKMSYAQIVQKIVQRRDDRARRTAPPISSPPQPTQAPDFAMNRTPAPSLPFLAPAPAPTPRMTGTITELPESVVTTESANYRSNPTQSSSSRSTQTQSMFAKEEIEKLRALGLTIPKKRLPINLQNLPGRRLGELLKLNLYQDFSIANLPAVMSICGFEELYLQQLPGAVREYCQQNSELLKTVTVLEFLKKDGFAVV